jgi:hypothetical protein
VIPRPAGKRGCATRRMSAVACGLAAAITTPFSCSNAPTAATRGMTSEVLVIAPATALLRPEDSVAFSALGSSAPGDDLLPVGAQWSVDDARVASVTPEGAVTAREVGYTRLVACRGKMVATHPIQVANEAPATWSGSYVPTSCASDCAQCCSMSMKDWMYPRRFRLRLRTIGERVTGEVTLLAGVAGNERSGAFEGSISGGTVSFRQANLVLTDAPRDICCVQIQGWTLDAGSATAAFTEIGGDPRLPIGRSLTWTNRILGFERGQLRAPVSDPRGPSAPQ